MQCDRCGGDPVTNAGRERAGRQQYRCRPSRQRFTARSTAAFSGFRFPDDRIAVAARWYLRLRLPYADVLALLAERGVHVDRSTALEWAQRLAPLYMEVARRRRRGVGCRWSVDEAYVKGAGVWRYVYRAIDEHGRVVGVSLGERRDTEAAATSFERALQETAVRPEGVTTDTAACYPPALQRALPEAEHLTGKRVQQRIERDHGHLKRRVRSMRGLKTERTAGLFCRAHGLSRNLQGGLYACGQARGDPRSGRAPRLVPARDELTQELQAA
jgi:transposase-like protein